MHLVQALQILAGVAWLGPLIAVGPGVWRVMRHPRHAALTDAAYVPTFFIGMVQIGFSLRWLIWHNVIPSMNSGELAAWSTLYLLSSLSAVAVVIQHYEIKKRT